MDYLHHLDALKWPYIYPVIIYLLVLMLIGIFGNIVVLTVYFKKFKPSTTRLFILTLATFDLLTCSLSIPGVIVELRFHYTFFFPALCKIFRASRMYFVLVSLLTLIIVAVDRFKKVCRPLKPQYTIRSAGYAILATNIVAASLTVLGAVVGGNRSVPTDKEGVEGSNCSYDDDFIGKPITKIYSGILFLIFIVSVILLVVLYSLIGRQVWKHSRFRFNPAKAEPSSSSSQNPTRSTAMKTVSISSPIKYKVQEEVTSGYCSDAENTKRLDASFSEIEVGLSNDASSESILSDLRGSSKQTKPKPKEKKQKQTTAGGQRQSTSKTTFTLFIITVVFIVSFLPFLILVALWGSNWQFVNNLSGYSFTVYKMFFHSYHVNNVINCYIYGFCNPRFRKECKQLFCSRKWRK